jgi:hypothetical protein
MNDAIGDELGVFSLIMMAFKWSALTGLALACTLFARNSQALPLVDSSAGLKLLAGADIWSAPSNVPPRYDGIGFVGTAGGFGYGALGYYELRIIKFIGLELDLAYQHGSFQRKISYPGFDVTESVTMNSLRLPILAKLNVPLGLGRLWLGVGPEFTLYQSSSGSLDHPAALPPPQPTISTRDVKPTFLTGGLGLVIEIPVIGIDIPLEFRASKNLSQPSGILERVTYTPTSEDVRAESSWVLRLGAGVGYRF